MSKQVDRRHCTPGEGGELPARKIDEGRSIGARRSVDQT